MNRALAALAIAVADRGCQNKAGGFRGSGTETIEWTQAKAIKGQLVGSGKNWGLTILDKKNMPTSSMPISSKRRRVWARRPSRPTRNWPF